MFLSCEHPRAARFFDESEERCRICSTSVSFPPHAPSPDDAKDRARDIRADAGELHRVYAPVEVVEASQPAPLLTCRCCREVLPANDFSKNAKNVDRSLRAHWCRPCTAFRLRIRRTQHPERFRARGRERRARHQASLTPEQKELEKARRGKSAVREATNAASRRYQARMKGRPVPRQRQGRQPIFIKQACRIAAGCPLRSYCTVEAKSLA